MTATPPHSSLQAEVVALTSFNEICFIDGEGVGTSDVRGPRNDGAPSNTVLCPDTDPPISFSCLILAGPACTQLVLNLDEVAGAVLGNANLQFSCDTSAPSNCVKACAAGSQADTEAVATALDQDFPPPGGQGALEVGTLLGLGVGNLGPGLRLCSKCLVQPFRRPPPPIQSIMPVHPLSCAPLQPAAPQCSQCLPAPLTPLTPVPPSLLPCTLCPKLNRKSPAQFLASGLGIASPFCGLSLNMQNSCGGTQIDFTEPVCSPPPPAPPPPTPPPPTPPPPPPPTCASVLDCVSPPGTAFSCASCEVGFCSYTAPNPDCSSPQPSCPATVGSNLIQNPGFEDCDIAPLPCLPYWLLDTGTAGNGDYDDIVDIGICRSGSNCLQLGSTSGDNGAAQTITPPTTAGTTYQLTLWAAIFVSNINNYLRITVDGATLQITQLASSGVYVQLGVTFTAVGSTTTISILGFFPADFIYVDDVSLAACGISASPPPPSPPPPTPPPPFPPPPTPPPPTPPPPIPPPPFPPPPSPPPPTPPPPTPPPPPPACTLCVTLCTPVSLVSLPFIKQPTGLPFSPACVRLALILDQVATSALGNASLQFSCASAPINCDEACAAGSQSDTETVAKALDQDYSPSGGQGALEVSTVRLWGIMGRGRGVSFNGYEHIRFKHHATIVEAAPPIF